ncbi:MAG: hypothetical protein ACJ8C4_10590 [Gemmataceae bacterium]
MPMDQVRVGAAITKAELHRRIRKWLAETDEHIIGPTGTDERTAWIHVQDGGSWYKLHADANRPAIAEYLQLVDEYGDDIEWHVVENQRGNMNAVAFGPDAKRLSNTLYLYLVGG